MAEENLVKKLEEGITRLVLNRPKKLNAMDSVMRRAITEALDEIDALTETRVLILAAAPSYLWIYNEHAEICDAREFWGQEPE